MINMVWDQGFKRAYKKKVKHNETLKGLFWEAVEKFSKNPFDKR